MKTIQLKTDWSEITFYEFQQIDQIINADINEKDKPIITANPVLSNNHKDIK